MVSHLRRQAHPTDAVVAIVVLLMMLLVLPLRALARDLGADIETTKTDAGEQQQPAGAHLEEAAQLPHDEAAKKKFVTNVFYDTSLRQVLADIATQTGVIIVPDISVQGIVTCELHDVPLDEALQIVLSVGNFTFRHMDGYILVGSTEPDSPSFSKLSETRRLRLNYVKAEDAVKMLSEPMRKFASANAATNTVCVTAPPPVLERILGDIRLLDEPPQQILLDALVVCMGSNDLLNLGVEWDWPKVSAGMFSNSDLHGKAAPAGASWPWGIGVGYTPGKEFTNSLLLTLNLLAQNDEATIIASPQVMAQDGKEAEIKVTTEEYFEILTQSYYYVRGELEKIEVGTKLKITPRVGNNGDITLEMSTEASDVVARGANNLPVVTRRIANSAVRVENGGTAVVAGLVDDRRRQTNSRVPGIGMIPLLGSLFRNDAASETRRQVAVFVTPRLMPQREAVLSEMPAGRAAIDPVGREFKKALAESLSRARKAGM